MLPAAANYWRDAGFREAPQAEIGPLSQPDTAVQPAKEQRSYTMPWGTIARLEARLQTGEPSKALQPDLIRRWTLDRGSSATYHRSGGNQPAYQSMINRRFMIVPPALPSGGHAE